ncbi:MAG: hypothetical protein ACI9LA_001388 [Bacteroidia bacterium]|jgi:hypothetical protein
MLEVGEKVRYLDDVGEATILKFLDKKTALVEDEYGLSHPHPISQLVPAERDHVPDKPAVVKLPPTPSKPQAVVVKAEKANVLPELCLAFVSSSTNRPETGDLEVFFCNQGSYAALVNVSAKENEEWFSVFHGEVKPNSNALVQSLRRQDVGLLSNLKVDVIFFRSTGYEYRPSLCCSTKIKATRFVKPGNYASYSELDNPAIMVAIEHEKLASPVAGPITTKRSVSAKKRPSLPVFEEEVDLHLEHILGHEPENINIHEKFLTQMRHFERRLNNALTHNYVEITFIHGVGTGRLKQAIREELKEYGLPYTDGPFHKYGVGATVVQLT